MAISVNGLSENPHSKISGMWDLKTKKLPRHFARRGAKGKFLKLSQRKSLWSILMDDTDLLGQEEVSRCHSWSLTNTIRMKSVTFGKLITFAPTNEWNSPIPTTLLKLAARFKMLPPK